MSHLPYGRQWIDEDDIAAVVDVLRGDWLTTGPMVERFEQELARLTGAREAVAVSSGTAALHAAMHVLDVGPGDEVIVPALTFAASANCVVYQGGTPIFADVNPDTLLLDPADIEAKITTRTKGIIAVDYAGQPCDYDRLNDIARRHDLFLVADACHALGATYRGRPAGSLALLNIFSFHPVKHIATGEGGAITTDDAQLAERLRRFRNHGITTDHRQRQHAGSWYYEMVELGFNYRLTDIQCALGLSQLRKLPAWLARRRQLAAAYDVALADIPGVQPLRVGSRVEHAYHLYVIRLAEHIQRAAVFATMRAQGIGVNVHYIPVTWHPFYQERYGTQRGLVPNTEQAYEQILSLPMFPRMDNVDVQRVTRALQLPPPAAVA